MAKLRTYRVPTQVAWASAGTISQELSPISFPITGMLLILRGDFTTSGGTVYNDPYDRIISTLSLTGFANGQNKTFFSFTNMRAAYHLTRFQLREFATTRPLGRPTGDTNYLGQFAYYFHFGVRPFKNSGELDHMDMTAAIPPTAKGQLTLGGTWASGTNVMGSATTTTNDADMDVYLIGLQEEPGDNPLLFIPQAFPVWSMTSPTPTATSTIFGTPYNITSGNFLRAMMLMLTRGSNYPRDQQVLNSIRIYDQRENREIIGFGVAGTGNAGGGDYKAAEFFTQLGLGAAPRSDDVRDGTVGTPSLNHAVDVGLTYFKFSDYTNRVHPLYGADLRGVATGDYRMDMGVNNVTTIVTDVVYERYELNPLHPANAAYL